MIASAAAIPSAAVIEWAARGRPFAGETESGDIHVAEPFAGGALVGLIDGLGHGDQAAAAARAAVEVLERDPMKPALSLMEACHAALRRTRGAVISLASIDARRGEMTWLGVGNVEAVHYRAGARGLAARDRIVTRSGVVGYQIPPLRPATTPIAPTDVLVFASDGLRHEFAQESPLGSAVDAYAAHLVEAYGKSSDDVLVLVVRYLGAAS
jgi:negative regulator of sigma-B (phosphoserine phosphatase)